MPCYDSQAAEDNRQNAEDAKMKGVLCQLVQKFGFNIVMKTVDWNEAGVNPNDFTKWWNKHQKIDAKRESN